MKFKVTSNIRISNSGYLVKLCYLFLVDDAYLMVRMNYSFLKNEVIIPDALVDQLVEKSLISDRVKDDIESTNKIYLKSDLILKSVLSNADHDSCTKFLDVIESTNPNVTKELWKRLQARREGK